MAFFYRGQMQNRSTLLAKEASELNTPMVSFGLAWKSPSPCARRTPVWRVLFGLRSALHAALSNLVVTAFGTSSTAEQDKNHNYKRSAGPVVLESFYDVRELGRFVLVRDRDVVAGGIVTHVRD